SEVGCKEVAGVRSTAGQLIAGPSDQRGVVPAVDVFRHGCFYRLAIPRPRDQFFEPQPARKSRTSSPGWNTAAGVVFPNSAILRLISAKSAFTQPTLDTSISPSVAIQKML